MNYITLNISGRGNYSMLEFEKLKSQINNILTLEFVDNNTIYWDDEGELLFYPPLHKSSRTYWISLLNKVLDPSKWEVRYSYR